MYMQYRTNFRQNTDSVVAGTAGIDHRVLAWEPLFAGDLAGLKMRKVFQDHNIYV